MSTPPAVTYRTLHRRPHVLRVFALAMIGRFGYAMIALALLFTCSHASGSFALAALIVAIFGTSGLVMPVQARLLDQLGQRRVLGCGAALFVVICGVTTGMGAVDARAPWLWCAVALGMGMSAPALGPSMRAQWREIASDGDDARAVAYALDAVAEEVVFLAGPLVVGVMLTYGPAWPAVAVAAVFIAVGVCGLVTSPWQPAPRTVSAHRRSRRGPLRRVRFLSLIAAMAASGLVLSLTMTTLAALADAVGSPGVVGAAETAAGLASVVGGWWWGRAASSIVRWSWPHQLAALLLARAPLCIVAVVHPSLWWVAAVVSLNGLTVAPTFIVGFTASDAESEPEEHTEASTWLTAAGNVGGSLGTAMAGLFTRDVGWAFMVGAGLTVAAGVAMVGVRTGRR